MPIRSSFRIRHRKALVSACVFLTFALAAQAASAASGGIPLRDASEQLVEGGDRPPQRGDGVDGGAPQAIPLRTPAPAKLRAAKARAAEDLAPGERAPKSVVPSPKASVFGGLNKPGMFANSASATPPDTTGAIGPSHYLEFVNSIGITAYDRELNAVSGPVALEDFIGFPFDSVFDPQIQWDENWGRWIYVMDDIEGPEDNYLAFGWSKTADPSNLTTEFPGEGAGAGWCEYFIYTGELFDDYPKLGHSNSGITIGTNVFEAGFLGSRLWSIAKPASPESCPTLAEGSIASTGALFTEDGDLAFTPVPANTADSSANSYVVAADAPFISGDAQVMGWHVTGGGTGATLFEDGNMTVGAFELPANVPQPGTANLLDSSDTRLTNAVAITDPAVGKEAVWTQHTIDGAGGRSAVRWYELLPATQTVRQEGTISDPSHFVFNGAISPDIQGSSAAINFNRGSTALFPDMHARSRDASTPLDAMEGDVLLGTSAGAAVDFSCSPCRWGDYAGASPDPAVPGLIWGSNQGLAAPVAEQARWTTRNFALVGDEAAPLAPTIAGSDPASPANDNNPKLLGSAEAGSTVRLYRSSTCSGPVEAQGSAAAFGSPGIGVSVADNSTTQFTATATDPVGNTSPCSGAFAYTEQTPPIPPPPPGIAIASGFARVQGGKALLKLRCPGLGACSGKLRLIARVKVGKGKGAKSSKRRVRNLVIGRAAFALGAGKSRLLRVPLTRKGRRLVRRAGKRGLRVKLRGKGVKSRSVRLKVKRRR